MKKTKGHTEHVSI